MEAGKATAKNYSRAWQDESSCILRSLFLRYGPVELSKRVTGGWRMKASSAPLLPTAIFYLRAHSELLYMLILKVDPSGFYMTVLESNIEPK